MLPVISIGPLALQAPGLILLLGVWMATWWIEKNSQHFNMPSNWLTNLIIVTLLCGVLGSRLVYVLRNLSAFAGNPLSLISPSPAMLDLEGGILLGSITALILARRKFNDSAGTVSLWSVLDALTPGFTLFGIALGFAHLSSGDAYGLPTDLPWSIWLWGTPRHPTQIYEIILASLIAWGMWRMLRLRSHSVGIQIEPGLLFLVYLAVSAFSRIFQETFRGDGMILIPLGAGGLRVAQAVSWVVLAFSLWLIGKRYPYSLKPPTM